MTGTNIFAIIIIPLLFGPKAVSRKQLPFWSFLEVYSVARSTLGLECLLQNTPRSSWCHPKIETKQFPMNLTSISHMRHTWTSGGVVLESELSAGSWAPETHFPHTASPLSAVWERTHVPTLDHHPPVFKTYPFRTHYKTVRPQVCRQTSGSQLQAPIKGLFTSDLHHFSPKARDLDTRTFGMQAIRVSF